MEEEDDHPKLLTNENEFSPQTHSPSHPIHQFHLSCKQKEDEFGKTLDDQSSTSQLLEKHVQVFGDTVQHVEFQTKHHLSKALDYSKYFFLKIMECLDDDKVIDIDDETTSLDLQLDDEHSMAALEGFLSIARLAASKVNHFKEMKKKEKRELENSVVSLTEENRDINTLLRVALVEKEAVEKSFNKFKGNTEPKRVALLQIAERGLQRVGFGFMMGSGSSEQLVESSGASNTTTTIASTTASTKSDSSECEEEVVSLASTMERIMKNLRLEITQLRRSLEESRSDTERLQSLTEKQAQEIAESTLYIKELEDRENVLAQNVEELLTEIKETEAEVARWKEACELEVEAGKNEIGERDKVVVILQQELEKTKAALDISNGKLKMKEELADAAMAAQAAAERSLYLADSRAAGLREQIEELTKQLEAAESRERSRRKVRHICWPWRVLKVNPANNANTRVQTVKRMLPEMQALLHYGA